MLKVLFVIPSLGPGGAAKQLTLLAPGLPRDRFQGHVCALGQAGPFAVPLEEAGLAVTTLGWARRFDLRPVLALRHLVREFDPDVIHAWGTPALWTARLAAGRGGRHGRTRRRVVVSAALPPAGGGRGVGWLNRWLLRCADRVVAQGPTEAGRCRHLGLSDDQLAVVAPAVATLSVPAPQGDPRRSLGLPEGCRLVVCAGPLEPRKGFGDALWAFEILRYVAPDLHLMIVGDGSDRRKLEAAARIGKSNQIHFLGTQPDAAELLALGDVVWIPSLAEGGVNVALEAMAATRPVVASRLPGLAEVILDGTTGCLVARGDRAALARQTWLLLGDADRRRRLGEAGRLRATGSFGVAALRRRFSDLYESLAG
jgi:glycosyltransferase involved in cell wall biosynthesis